MRKFFKRFPFYKVFVTLFISLYTLLPSVQAVGVVVKDYASEDVTVETEIDTENQELEVDTSEDILDEGISDPEWIVNPELEEDTEEEVEEEADEPLFVYEDGVYTVFNVIEGEEYVYPSNDNLRIEFTSVTEDGNLVIERVVLTEEEKEKLNTSDNYGWDITSSMSNGSFTYNLTLPNTLGNDVEVVYTEDGENYNKLEAIVNEDVIHIYGLEHFTTFVVVSPGNDPSKQIDCDAVKLGSTTGTTCFDTIQGAINAASGGETIYVGAGTYEEPNGLNITESITITGSGENQTIVKISRPSGGYGIQTSSDLNLELVMRNLSFEAVSGVSNFFFHIAHNASFTLENSTVTGMGRNYYSSGAQEWGNTVGGVDIINVKSAFLNNVTVRETSRNAVSFSAVRNINVEDITIEDNGAREGSAGIAIYNRSEYLPNNPEYISINRGLITGSPIGMNLGGTKTGVDLGVVSGDDIKNLSFVNNQVQAIASPDEAKTLLENNTFDKAVVVRKNPIVVPVIFSSIQDAIDAAEDGDTIYVDVGTYNENIVIDKELSLQGEDKDTTIIDGGKSGKVVSIVSDNVLLSGFTVINSGSTPLEDGAIVLQGANHCTIEDNIVSNNGGVGIGLQLSDGNTIQNNTLDNNNIAGIGLLGSSNNTVQLNESRNTRSMSGQFGYGLIIDNFEGTNPPTTTIFSKNNVIGSSEVDLNNGPNTFADNEGDGIYIGWGCDNNSIVNNIIDRNGNDGIYLWKSGTNQIINNEVSENQEAGIQLMASPNNTISGNTIVNSNIGVWLRSGWTQYKPHQADHLAMSENNDITNNNIYGNSVFGIKYEQNDYEYDDGISIDATLNWWGHITGPSGEGSGHGDKVSTNVTYQEWLCEPYKTGWYSIDGSCAMRDIGFGYGSGINGDVSDPGMCNVYTNDTSLPGNKALQILQFHTLSGAEYYMIQGYRWNGSKWLASGTPYDPEEYANGKPNVEFSIDNGVATYKTGATNEGIYTYQVMAYSLNDNLMGLSNRIISNNYDNACKFTVDRTSPLAPELISPEEPFYTQGVYFEQKWESVEDAVKYEYNSCYNDPDEDDGYCNLKYPQTFIGKENTTKKVNAEQPDSHFWWRVRAQDIAGNWSEWSEAWEVIIDNTSPMVEITSHTNGQLVRGTQTVQGIVEDFNLSHYWFVIHDSNGKRVAGPNIVKNSGPIVTPSFEWNTKNVADGIYTIKLEAKDLADNKDSGSVHWVGVSVDNTPPTVSNISIEKDGNPATQIKKGDILIITATVTDDYGGVKAVSTDFSFNSTYSSRPSPTSIGMKHQGSGIYKAEYTVPETWDTDQIFITVAARDKLDNYSGYRNLAEQLIVDNTPPVTEIQGEQSYTYTNEAIFIEGISTDENGVSHVDLYYRVSDSEDPWTPIGTSPFINNPADDSPFNWDYSWTPDQEGTYDIKASATDIAGNVEESAYIYEITYDETNPTVTLLSLINGILQDIRADGGISGVKSIEVGMSDTGPWETYSSNMNLNTFVGGQPGTYTVYIRIVDNAGNETIHEVTFTIPSPPPTTAEEILGAITGPFTPQPAQATGIGGYLLAQTIEEETEEEVEDTKVEDTEDIEDEDKDVRGTEDENDVEEEQESRPWWIYPLIILPLLLLFIILWKRRKEEEEPQY